jgi:GH15 family glucan-1,4-alpha-glucosidase
MRRITEYQLKPFRLGKVKIDAVWIEGKAHFLESVISDWLGYRKSNSLKRLVKRNPCIEEFREEIELVKGETVLRMVVYNIGGLMLIAVNSRKNKAIQLEIEAATLIWELTRDGDSDLDLPVQ